MIDNGNTNNIVNHFTTILMYTINIIYFTKLVKYKVILSQQKTQLLYFVGNISTDNIIYI